MSSSARSVVGGGMILLSIALFVAAFGATGVLYWNSYTHYRMGKWVELEATLTSASLDRSTSHSTRGGSSTTYKALATYQYEYEGKKYTGNRLGIHTWGHDNLGSWQRNTASRLQRHHRQKKPVPVFVDPNAPSQSVLDRKLRLEVMLMATIVSAILGGIALATLLGTLKSMSRVKHRERAIASGKLWTIRDDWAQGVIRSAPIRTLRWALPTTIYLAVVTVPGGLMLPEQVRGGNGLGMLLLIGPGLAAVFGWICVRALIRQMREGTTDVKLATIPGVIGGNISGVIHTPQDLPEGTATEISLRCDKTVWEQSHSKKGKGAKRLENQWSGSQKLVVDLAPGIGDGSAIPFDLEIPYGLPPTSFDDEPVHWTLDAKSLGGDIGFQMKCEVPVFVTQESQPHRDGQRESLVAQYQQPVSPESSLSRFRVRVRRTGEVTNIVARGNMMFGPMATLAVLMFAADIGSIAVFLSGGPWILGGIFGILGFLMTWGFLHTVLWGCKITASGESIAIRSGATFFCGTQNYSASALERLEMHVGSSAGNHTFYEVFLGDRDHSSRIGKGIKDRQNAEEYAQAMWSLLSEAPPPKVTIKQFGSRK